MKTIFRCAATLLLLAALNSQLSTAFAQGTAFAYQGRLNSGLNPAAGIYDLRFAIYDSTNLPGTLLAGPVTNSAVAVTNGLFTTLVDLGNAFTGTSSWLEIAVRSNGMAGFTTLSPRQQITPVPYALQALNATAAATATSVSGPVAASQITGTLAAANIGAGTITSNDLAAGAAAANLNGISQTAVPSGGLILSATENTALLNAGYVKIGTVQGGETWQQRVNGTTPAARYSHTAVWTGSEMIVWGGYNGSSYLNDTWSYTPSQTMYLYQKP